MLQVRQEVEKIKLLAPFKRARLHLVSCSAEMDEVAKLLSAQGDKNGAKLFSRLAKEAEKTVAALDEIISQK